MPELTNDNITIKLKSLDLLVRCKNEKINIELNTYSNVGLRRKMFIDAIKDEGKLEGKINVAKNMIKENIDMETIIKVTGLTKEEIDKL